MNKTTQHIIEDNAYTIASKIFALSNTVVNNDHKAKLHAELENIIKEIEAVKQLPEIAHIEYFDLNLVFKAAQQQNADQQLISIIDSACDEQVEKWSARLANNVDTHKPEVFFRLNELAKIGSTITRIKNHGNFQFLCSFLAQARKKENEYEEEIELTSNDLGDIH